MTTENKANLEATVIQAQISDPKATQGVFELPCGYLSPEGDLITEVEVRELTGVEEDMLAAKNIPGGKKFTQLIGNCLKRLGPMTDRAMVLAKARELTVGDRSFLMFAIRRVTLGDSFPFEAVCPECEKKNLYTVDLSELDVKKMPDPKKRVYEAALPSGKKVFWHVMTGKEEEILSKVKPDDTLSAAILVRLDTLNGMPVSLATVKGLSMRDREFLRDAFNEAEGGVETELDLLCPDCAAEFKDELSVGQTGFFFPSRIQKSWRKSTSSS